MKSVADLSLVGNHAQALALAARTYGIRAHVVMPTISTPSKIAATQGYGAEVVFSGSTSQEREAVVEDVIKRTGAILVPPYDHPNVRNHDNRHPHISAKAPTDSTRSRNHGFGAGRTSQIPCE